jgi:hypothetical protein
VLGLRRPPDPPIVFDEGRKRLDGVLIRRLRWSVGYGPDTSGWLLRPAGVRRSLPGVLGMHCHGGVRSVGAEQLVDLGADSSSRAVGLRDADYSGRAPANELARQGYAVFVHDTFHGPAGGSISPVRRLGWPRCWKPKARSGDSVSIPGQYRIDDERFPRAGMEAAHDQLLRLHAGTKRYRGSFTPGGHTFDAAMQDEAWAFLAEAL